MSEFMCSFLAADPRDSALPLLVTSIGLNSIQNQIVRENGYADFHFFRCISGEGTITAGSKTFHVKKNMGFVLFPEEPHRYSPVKEPWLIDWITFTGAGAAPLLTYLGIGGSMDFDLLHPGPLASNMREFAVILKKSKLSQKLDLSCQLYKILSSLYGTMPSGGSRPRGVQYEKIEPSIRYIEQNCSRPLDLEQIAAKAGVTPKYFCRLFYEAMHMRPFQFVNSLRINECKRLLLEKREMNISEIAWQCGYESVSYFNQVFKAATGMSPKEFRRLN